MFVIGRAFVIFVIGRRAFDADADVDAAVDADADADADVDAAVNADRKGVQQKGVSSKVFSGRASIRRVLTLKRVSSRRGSMEGYLLFLSLEGHLLFCYFYHQKLLFFVVAVAAVVAVVASIFTISKPINGYFKKN